MSFIKNDETSKVYAPGYFLSHEECTRETREIPQSMATDAADGSKYVPMGTVYPETGDNAEGIVYEDVDVTLGNMPGSVVTRGEVFTGRIPLSNEQLTASTVTALEAKGFKFVEESEVTRPY